MCEVVIKMLYRLTYKDANEADLQGVVNGVRSEKEAIAILARASKKCFPDDSCLHLDATKQYPLDKWDNKDGLEQKGDCSGTATILLCNGQVVPFTYSDEKGIKSVYNKAIKQYKQIKVLFITKRATGQRKAKRSASAKAEVVLKDKEMTTAALHKFKERVVEKKQEINLVGKQNPNLMAYIQEIPTLYYMLQDYIKGNYKEIPFKSILGITAAVLYFICPLDLLPDFIPVLGQLDDIGVLIKAVQLIYSDVMVYKAWKERTSKQVAK